MPEIQRQSLSDKETEAIIQALDNAEKCHIDWLAAMHESLICGAPIQPNVLEQNAHETCRFGHWYYQKSPDIIHGYSEFKEIGEIHQWMHDEARHIAQKAKQGEAVSVGEYRSFIHKQQELIRKINTIRDNLHTVLLSFDSLTGALSREAFMLILHQEYEQFRRSGKATCVAMADLDHFKSINDQYGHLIGDKVLHQTARSMGLGLRPYDSLCRYGGEEFLICLPETNLDKAENILNRVRHMVEELTITTDNNESVKVTISFGVAIMKAEFDFNDTIAQADDALYEAKNQGRNRVVVWQG